MDTSKQYKSGYFDGYDKGRRSVEGDKLPDIVGDVIKVAATVLYPGDVIERFIDPAAEKAHESGIQDGKADGSNDARSDLHREARARH